MICSRCGHKDLTPEMKECPNCGLQLDAGPKTLAPTGTFRALASRRKMLTQRHYALPFAIGDELFGRFKARDILGQGPLGVVYQVTDAAGQLSAIKVLHKRWAEELDRDSFQGELLSLDALDAPHLCAPSEVLIYESTVGLLLPLQGGLTLRKLMNLRKGTGKSFRLSEVEIFLKGVHAALRALHAEGVAHGGIKPENIFLSADDSEGQHLTLSDPRLSAAMGLEAFSTAQRAAGHGHSVAPELAEGSLTPAADIFSVGALTFEAFTGQVPQVGRRSLMELMQVRGVEPLDALLQSCLDPSAAARPQDIDAFMRRFDQVSAQLRALPGAPFSAEGTQPSAEVEGGGQSETGVVPLSDPLLGVVTPPPLPVPLAPQATQPDFEPRTMELASIGYEPPRLSETPPPAIPAHLMSPSGRLTAQLTSQITPQPSPPTLPLPNLTPHQTPPPTLDALSRLQAEPLVELSPALERVSREPSALTPSAPAPQPLITRPAPSGPWLLSSTLGFSISALLVVGVVATGVFYLLREPQPVGRAVVEAPDPALALKAAEEEAARLRAAEEAARLRAAEELAAAARAAEEAARLKAAEELAAAARASEAQAAAPTETPAPVAGAREAAEERSAAAAAREARAQAAREAKEAAAAEREARAQAAREAKEAAAAEREARAQAAREAKEGDRALKVAEREVGATSAEAPQKASVVEVNGTLQCPSGMWLRTKKPFPKNSVLGDRVKGAAAIELAKSGEAYCIDGYEYPGRGQLPKVNVSFSAAESLCSQVNKRLCTDDEWRRACRGAGDFPYGKAFDGSKCNTEDAEGEERKLAPGGSFKSCKSGGLFDMSGNAAEWTANQTVRGGYYASADEDAACGGGGRHAPSSQRPYIGFRCCADLK